MGVTGHNCRLVFLRLVTNCANQRLYKRGDFGCVVAQIEANVEGNLVVTAASGVKSLSCITDSGGKLLLDEHVNILGGHVDFELSFFEVT